jgi:hypothetical protein
VNLPLPGISISLPLPLLGGLTLVLP